MRGKVKTMFEWNQQLMSLGVEPFIPTQALSLMEIIENAKKGPGFWHSGDTGFTTHVFYSFPFVCTITDSDGEIEASFCALLEESPEPRFIVGPRTVDEAKAALMKVIGYTKL